MAEARSVWVYSPAGAPIADALIGDVYGALAYSAWERDQMPKR